ncbi:MAG: ribbon-helix-helix protein, CopG family [Rhodospirillales bacterium]|nr:ribbon-helix-helix protein, CopG family [Rhodospirillales bacterium]
MAKTNLSIRIDDETRERLDLLAAKSGRNRSSLIEDALKVYLDHETWLTGQIELGKDAAGTTPRVEHPVLLAAVASVIREASS